jgi:lipoyl(octanoyl) transferase
LPQTEAAVAWELSLEPDGRPGAENMAVDAALLAAAARTGRSFLRLYRFAPPCLSLGRNEPVTPLGRTTIARMRLDVVRRPTGGRAVWHEHEVTYAVAAPIAAFGGLRQGYRAIHSRLAAALRSLGVDATLAPDRLGHRPLDGIASCFATPAGGEVLIGGRKVIGSAQVRQGCAFLQHGSILLAGSQAVVRLVSHRPVAACHETTLAAVLGRPVSFGEVADALIAAWGDETTSVHAPQPPRSSVTGFSDPAWTWRPLGRR